MKKIFTFVAAALMAVSAFAAKETVMDVNYAQLAVDNVALGQGETLVRNTADKNKVNGTDLYPFTAGEILAESAVMISRGDGLLRFSDVRNIGLFNNNKNFYGIKALQAGDVIEIAYNGGGNSDGSAKAIPAMSDIYNMSAQEAAIDTFTLNFTTDKARTWKYPVFSFTATADGPVAFALQTAYIAYIKVTRGSDDYEIVNEVYDFQTLGQAQASEGTVDVTFGTEVLTSPASIKLISFGEETFENRFAGNRDWAIRKHSNAAYCGLYNKNGYSGRYLAIMGLEEGNEVTIDFLCDSEQSLIFENAIVEDATAGDALVSGTTYTISEDGNLLLNEGANTANKRVYIYKVTISKKVAKEGGDDTPTAIEDVKSAVKAVKMIENGQVVIVRDGVRYNVLGARL